MRCKTAAVYKVHLNVILRLHHFALKRAQEQQCITKGITRTYYAFVLCAPCFTDKRDGHTLLEIFKCFHPLMPQTKDPEGLQTGKLPTMKNNCTKGISQLSEDRWLKHSIANGSLSPPFFLCSCFYWAWCVLFAQSLFTLRVFPCLWPCRVHFVFSTTKQHLKHIHNVYVPAFIFWWLIEWN